MVIKQMLDINYKTGIDLYNGELKPKKIMSALKHYLDVIAFFGEGFDVEDIMGDIIYEYTKGYGSTVGSGTYKFTKSKNLIVKTREKPSRTCLIKINKILLALEVLDLKDNFIYWNECGDGKNKLSLDNKETKKAGDY